MSHWEYTETELWRHGEKGISLYHVFGAVATDSAVLVFAEARSGDGSDDRCPHHIQMRRSTDGGKTFSDDICLIPSGENHCWTNPVPLYDRQTKRLFLFYSDNLKNVKTENYLIFSDDDGLTWSQPRHINGILEEAENSPAFHLAGPGHGIQLQNGPKPGRLVMPFWHRYKGTDVPKEQRGYCVSVLLSDDHGASWTRTETTGFATFSNESGIAETGNGLIRIIRVMDKIPCISRSTNGGTTWSEPQPSSLPPAAICDMGVLQVRGKEGFSDMVLVSRVSHPDKRHNMEIRISYDGGEHFDDTLLLMPGDAMPAYSDLCLMEEGDPVVGLLHCRNNHILFSRISLQTLTQGKYENTSRTVWLK